jgi:hypothetical protein
MGRSLDGGRDQPDDEGMDQWQESVEARLAALERDVAIIRSNYATKEDLHREMEGLHKEINTQTWRLVTFVCGFGTALVAATYFIVTHAR